MSHFARQQVQFKNLAILGDVLAKRFGNSVAFNSKVRIWGDQTHDAHLVVKSCTGGLNLNGREFGFNIENDGVKLICDDMDEKAITGFLGTIKQDYAEALVRQEAKTNGYLVSKDIKNDGRVVLRLMR